MPWALFTMPVFDADNEEEVNRATDEREETDGTEEESKEEEEAPKVDKGASTSRLDL